MDRNAKGKIIYIIVGVAALLLVSGVVAYRSGYRFQSNFLIGKVGTLEVTLPFSQTSIFIDDDQKITTTKDNEPVSVTLSPADHRIIISHESYFPWTKNISVPSGGKVSISPIFVPQNTSGQIITNKDPEYAKLRRMIVLNPLPTENSPITSADNSVKIWLDDNAIVAQTGSSTPTVVIQPDTVIRGVHFYKDRNDAVIFSTLNTIYVIEIDTENTQNFIPVYRGQSPSFIKLDADSIYVLDGNILMQVVI